MIEDKVVLSVVIIHTLKFNYSISQLFVKADVSNAILVNWNAILQKLL